jgi:hypothetical protein
VANEILFVAWLGRFFLLDLNLSFDNESSIFSRAKNRIFGFFSQTATAHPPQNSLFTPSLSITRIIKVGFGRFGSMKISAMGFVMAARLSIRRVDWRLLLLGVIISKIGTLVISGMRYGGRSRPSRDDAGSWP